MRILKFLSLLLLASTASAQGLIANGQVYLPNGQPAREEIRIEVAHESGRRGPYSLYTDLMGRFELRDLAALATYRLTVKGEDDRWADTTITFIPSGVNPRVILSLQPVRKAAGPSADSVSVNTLQQRVPSDASKEFEAATKFIRKNDYASAQPHLERAVALYPQYVDAHNELGVALMRGNKLTDAEAHFRVALDVDSTAVRPMMNLGLCLSRQERFGDAIPVLEKVVQLASGEPTGHLLLGVAQLQTSKVDEAEASLKKAYELGGKKVAQAQYYLATLYVHRNDAAQAAAALETYLRDNPNDPNAPQIRANIERLKAAAAKQ